MAWQRSSIATGARVTAVRAKHDQKEKGHVL